MNKTFRDSIKDICHKYNYHLVDYGYGFIVNGKNLYYFNEIINFIKKHEGI